jgi:peptidoglycan/LPS O-acetylase OafA/YrhL
MKINFPYCNLLDGLRGFAIVAVLYAHSALSTIMTSKFHLGTGGFIGVDIFFVLSSFLISTLLLKEYLSQDSISVKNFYIRRFIRLSPPLVIAIVVFTPIFFLIDWKVALKDLFYTLTYSTNLARSLQNFIPPVLHPRNFSHTWSLATEEQFYLVFPLLFLYLLSKKINIFANVYLLFIFATAIFMTAPILKPILGDGVYDFPLWRTGEFFIGFITALIYANIVWLKTLNIKAIFLVIPSKQLANILNLIKSRYLTFVSFCILFSLIIFLRLNSWAALIFGHPLASILSSFLILQATVCPNKIIKYFLGSKIMIKLGVISYGLYIYHYPILNIKGWLLIEKIKLDQIIILPSPLNSAAIIFIHDIAFLFVTLLMSFLSYKYIEKPVLKYKLKFASDD